MRYLKLISLLCVLLYCFFFTQKTHAAVPYKVTYDAQYIPTEANDFNVSLKINITNLRSDLYVREFSLSFPSYFKVENVEGTVENQSITTEIERDKSKTQISFSLPENTAQKDVDTTVEITYVQKNGFKKVGTVAEIILPSIQSENSTFNLKLQVPNGISTHVALSKPKPSQVVGDTLVWNNITDQIVYVVFGTSQLYQTSLNYTLKNPDLVTRKTTIALIPETAFQKVYIQKIEPRPKRVSIDTDGNYLATYSLLPKQELVVKYSGIVELFPRAGNDVQLFSKNSYEEQKRYIFNGSSYWKLPLHTRFAGITASSPVSEIYERVMKHLTYDPGQISSSLIRKGASMAIKRPNEAVCTEYTDLFVALARMNKIPAREIEGFAFSNDRTIQPLSFNGDILHSWPEYYNHDLTTWIPVDPTWQDTSGINYFDSFDLNHIAFAIHGKDAVIPLPAGMYKVRDRKDVEVVPISTKPHAVEKIDAQIFIDTSLKLGSRKKGILQITNSGNTFRKNLEILIKADGTQIKPTKIVLDMIAPMEKRSIEFELNTTTTNKKLLLTAFIDGKVVSKKQISVSSATELFINQVIGVVIGCITLFVIYKFLIRTRK